MLLEHAVSRTGNSQNPTVRFARLLTYILADLRSGKSTRDLAMQALQGAESQHKLTRVRKELLAMARKEVEDGSPLRGSETGEG